MTRGASRLVLWTGLVAAVLGAAPAGAAAQESAARCPMILQRVTVAARDSLLGSLEPGEIALRGFVRDEAGDGVAGVVVVIEGTSYGTLTSDDGGYLIRMRGPERVPMRPMVRACEPGWRYLTEIREVRLLSPSDGIIVVRDGVAMPEPGHAVRLDFSIRARPNVF